MSTLPVYLHFVLASVTALVAACSVSAQSITNLGVIEPGASLSRAVGVSSDGTYVAGYSGGGPAGQRAFRWSATGGFELFGQPNSTQPYGISGDGNTIVGQANGLPFAWRNGSMQGLYGGSGWFATASNSTGSVSVGAKGGYSGNRAVRWIDGASQSLDPYNNFGTTIAWCVSGDGQTIAGDAIASFGEVAFRWNPTGGMQSLGTLVGGNASWSRGISGDGTTIVGMSSSTSGYRAFRWTSSFGMVDLGTMTGGFSSATAVSGDGTITVGFGDIGTTTGAFIHEDSIGMVYLREYLAGRGVDLTGWDQLLTATAISANGRFVVGNGIFNGTERAFIADVGVVPAPGSIALLGIAGLTGSRRRR